MCQNPGDCSNALVPGLLNSLWLWGPSELRQSGSSIESIPKVSTCFLLPPKRPLRRDAASETDPIEVDPDATQGKVRRLTLASLDELILRNCCEWSISTSCQLGWTTPHDWDKPSSEVDVVHPQYGGCQLKNASKGTFGNPLICRIHFLVVHG